jgi:hypothetical protein
MVEKGENETTPTNSELHALLHWAQLIGSPLGPDPDVVVATMMPSHPEI